MSGLTVSQKNMSDDENNPFFFYAGYRFEANIGRQGAYHHWFGDTGNFKILNPPKKGSIHQLLELDLNDPTLSPIKKTLEKLPLYYSFQFEEGLLEYTVNSNGAIEITKLDIESFDLEWPYEGYPNSFGKKPISLTAPKESTLEDFQEDVWQWIDPEEKEKFIAVVPPSSLYGVNLWEEDSNFDHIHVKFFFNPETNSVRVYNECD